MLLTLVNDILDLATVDAGIMRLNYSEIDLGDLLDDVSMQIADRLQESGVTLEITAPAQLGTDRRRPAAPEADPDQAALQCRQLRAGGRGDHR